MFVLTKVATIKQCSLARIASLVKSQQIATEVKHCVKSERKLFTTTIASQCLEERDNRMNIERTTNERSYLSSSRLELATDRPVYHLGWHIENRFLSSNSNKLPCLNRFYCTKVKRKMVSESVFLSVGRSLLFLIRK